MIRSVLPPLLLVCISFATDRISKAWAAGYLGEHGAARLNSQITLVATYNNGIAFGALPGVGRLVGWLSVVIVVGLIIYLIRTPRSMWMVRYGLALVIGGSVGNMVDRVTVGQVLDFIQTPLRPGVFNVADVMIHLGLTVCLLGLILQRAKTPEQPLALSGEEGRHPLASPD